LNDSITAAAQRVIDAVGRVRAARGAPVLIAIDGPSGSGKSTIAARVARALNAALVPSDDFFAAEITDAEWDARGAAERAADAIDWRRLRREALEPLRAGRRAIWHPFDFDAGARPDGSYAMRLEPAVREPAETIAVEGAYAARPELSDLIDLAVRIDAPETVRRRRLAAREHPEFLARWHARWDDAEAWYFTRVRPASSFDLVLSTASDDLEG
jgi:para-aminobenzoate synthetase